MQGDPALLRQLLLNLFGNGLKFHRPGTAPVVRVDARRDGESGRSACRDNGIGVEPEYAEKIFVIFQRLHGREVYAGTGIGLALCQEDRRVPRGPGLARHRPPRRARHGHPVHSPGGCRADPGGEVAVTEPEVRCINVLLVEDDPGDVLMTREAFDEYKLHNRLDVVTDGAARHGLPAQARPRTPTRRART